MLMTYFNYPNSIITIHTNPYCNTILRQRSQNQRSVTININTISVELANFMKKHYKFASTADRNDMWIEIDFTDRIFEEAVVHFIHRLLNYYTPIRNASPNFCAVC
jgi:hypothetical protein